MSEPIAIIGLGCRLPGGANDAESLWQLLREGRNTWSEVPTDRYNWKSFYHPSPESSAGHGHRGGHFLAQDVAAFDAAFFGISKDEAEAMDPQQRILLEVAYEALENSGYSLETIKGSNTSVFVATFMHDYEINMYKDTTTLPRYGATGVLQTMASNRISYIFDLKGPSVTLNTGCSGSLVALHQAYQSLRLRESNISLVGGTNGILSPDSMIPMDFLHLLNKEGTCFSFDARGSGYGRSEGVAVVALKRLPDALHDCDPIWGIIKGTAVGQDGKTLGITLPDKAAQEELIRATYRSARLEPCEVGYVEAHGTGTIAGDVAEMHAIDKVFCAKRDAANPLFVGSIKANIGHLEATSGLAGMIKALLILKKGMIPSTPNLAIMKDGVKSLCEKIMIPTELQPWPSALARRASINSFGLGGTNAHAIIELQNADDSNIEINGHGRNANDIRGKVALPMDVSLKLETVPEYPKIIAITAKAACSLMTASINLRKWGGCQDESGSYLRKLAFTLTCRRSFMHWRYAFVASTHEDLMAALDPQARKTTRVANKNLLIFLFTGQGAQWPRMAQGLMTNCAVFKDSLLDSARTLEELGATWDLLEELNRDETTSRLHQSEIGQPATTVIQIGLMETLRSWNVKPDIVLGHSSGEIAAAYAAGALTKRSAIVVSYHRGFVAKRCKEILKTNGAMLAVQLGECGLDSYISRLQTGQVHVACLNSPTSSTASGDESAIMELKSLLDWSSIASQRLRVDTAYHSHHMKTVAEAYAHDLRDLEWKTATTSVRFDSSVSAVERSSDFGPSYWVENLVSRVHFSKAVENICLMIRDISSGGPSCYNSFVEIGPHTTLIRPVKQILTHLKLETSQFNCLSTLKREHDSFKTMLQTAATLFNHGVAVDLRHANSFMHALVGRDWAPISDLPPYPWNHSSSYWYESRLSRGHRLRQHPYHDLLGLRSLETSDLDPVWRHTVGADSLPWLKDHIIEGRMVFPGSAYVAMVVEAKKQMLLDRQGITAIGAYILKDVVFQKILVIPEAPDTIGIQLSLHSPTGTHPPGIVVLDEFRICSIDQNGEASEHCHGKVMTEARHCDSHTVTSQIPGLDFAAYAGATRFQSFVKTHVTGLDPKRVYKKLQSSGNYWGPIFALIRDFHFMGCNATGTVGVGDIAEHMPGGFMQPHVIHPAALDAIIHSSIFLWSRYGDKGIMLPVRMGDIRISAEIVSGSTEELTFKTTISPKNESSAIIEVYAYQKQREPGRSPYIELKDVELRATVRSQHLSTGTTTIKDMCYQVEWDLDLDLCNPSSNTFALREKSEDEKTSKKRLERLNILALGLMSRCYRVLSRYQVEKRHLSYYDWIISLQLHHGDQGTTHGDQNSIRQTPEAPDIEEEMLTRVGCNLTMILTGKIDPLPLLFKDNLLSRMYSEDSTIQRCYSHLIAYVKGLVFKWPDMRMLEIGAGTGGLTVPLLRALYCDEKLPLHSYHFTDVSSGFFPEARQKLAAWGKYIRYKTLDIGVRPSEQALDEGSFDLVLASNSLHTTKNIDEAIANARKLLKPGGRLVLIETTRLELFTNMTFGVLPGWYLDRNDGREESPILNSEQWHDRLLVGSFTGVEFAQSDIDGPAGRMTVIVTMATSTQDMPKAPRSLSVLVCPTSREENQAILQALMQIPVTLSMQISEHALPLQNISPEEIYLIVDSVEHPFVMASDPKIVEGLKWLLSNARNLLWITTATAPTTSSTHGVDWISDLALDCRGDNQNPKFVTLMVKADRMKETSPTSRRLCDIIQKSFHSTSAVQPLERNYFFGDEEVLIPRLKRNLRLQQWHHQTADREMTLVPSHQPDRILSLIQGRLGRSATCYTDNELSHGDHVAATDVEIQVEAYGIPFDSTESPSDQPNLTIFGTSMGGCAGVVTAVGSQMCHQFKLGDRVCAWGKVSFANRTHVDGNNVTHLYPGITSQVGASIPVAFLSAYYSLVNLANVSAGCSVLIQAAADSSGQAAVQVAMDAGASVFAVVRNEKELELLLNVSALSQDRIFMETQSFHNEVIRLTNGGGVDIILSLSKDCLSPKSFKCLARFGRYIGRSDPEHHVGLSGYENSDKKNFCIFDFDLTELLSYRPEKTQQIMNKIISMFEEHKLRPVHPLAIMDLSSIEEALKMVNRKDQLGILILTADLGTRVTCSPTRASRLKLCRNGTYVICGDFGNLGLDICRFMVLYGARHILFASIGNTQVEEQQILRDACQDWGIDAHVLPFDLTCEVTSGNASNNPMVDFTPVKGVVYGQMGQKINLSHQTHPKELAHGLRTSSETMSTLYDRCWSSDLDFFLAVSSSKRHLMNEYRAVYPSGLGKHSMPCMMGDGAPRKFMRVDLSGMEDSCLTVSDPDTERKLIRDGLIPMTETQLALVLQYAMDSQISDQDPKWLISGFDRLSVANSRNEPALNDPFFNHVGPSNTDLSQDQVPQSSNDQATSIEHAENLEEAQRIVVAALVQKLSSHVAIEESMIETSTAIEDFGLDSLVQWDLRNWMSTTFKVDLSSNEFSEANSVTELACLIIDRTIVKSIKERTGGEKSEYKNADGASTGRLLPRQPLPSLQETLQFMLEAIRHFLSDEDFKKTAAKVDLFRSPMGLGEQLQSRLMSRDSDVNIGNWLVDLYTSHRFLRPQGSVVAFSSYFLTHPSGTLAHGQAERAAMITLASLLLKQKLEAGNLSIQSHPMSGQPVDPRSYQWLFNACREPHIGEDQIRKHPTNDYIVVLRHGYLFKVGLTTNAGNLAFEELSNIYQHILSHTPNQGSFVSTLTTDDRDTWAVNRERLLNFSPENKASIQALEAAAFLVCLDDVSPQGPVDSFRQFLFSDRNRWYDKTLQHIICPNGISASLYEHAALDGASIAPLIAHIAAAVVEYPGFTNMPGQARAMSPSTTSEPLNIISDDSLRANVLRCCQNLTKTTSPLTFATLITTRLSISFLRKHKCPIQSGVQLAIQLACRRFYGYTPPAYETVSMAHFRQGRIEVNAIIGPAMIHFLGAAASKHRADHTNLRALLHEAAIEHNRRLGRVVKGRGYNRHLLALEWVLREGETRPALFNDVGYAKSKPGKAVTSNLATGGLEGGFAYPVAESILVCFDIQDNSVSFSISGSGVDAMGFRDLLRAAAEECAAILDGYVYMD